MSEKSIVKLHKDKKVFAPIMYKVHKPPGRELAYANREGRIRREPIVLPIRALSVKSTYRTLP